MGVRLTSSLNPAVNDTGRTAYCGPMVLSAVTGYSVSRVEAAIHRRRGNPEDARKLIEGTTSDDVAAALAVYGYGMDRIAQFWHLAKKERPSVWQWMQKSRSTWAHYILAVHRGAEGHWICIKGAKICDTYTDGKWVFAVDGPHRGARIMEVYQVRRMCDAIELAPTMLGDGDENLRKAQKPLRRRPSITGRGGQAARP